MEHYAELGDPIQSDFRSLSLYQQTLPLIQKCLHSCLCEETLPSGTGIVNCQTSGGENKKNKELIPVIYPNILLFTCS